MQLPRSQELDINALSALFEHTTTSYKILFFISLLEMLKERATKGQLSVREYSIKEIIVGMLRFGWYPHKYFQLSFGALDQVGHILDKLQFSFKEHTITNSKTARELTKEIQAQFSFIEAQRLRDYVPYRLLSPFFRPELKKEKNDGRRNKLIVELAATRSSQEPDNEINITFAAEQTTDLYRLNKPLQSAAEQSATYGAHSSKPLPLYYFDNNEENIVLNLKWQNYFLTNFSIVKSWALYNWAHFLQKRNPNSPSILNKIEPPIKRASLTQADKFWVPFMEKDTLNCIYSGQKLSQSSYDIDHFIPWSFICHDELWNLIPANQQANRSKGRSLPNQQHIERFIETQARALAWHKNFSSSKSWRKTSEHYIEGLALNESDLLKPELLLQAYQNKLKPLISLANNLGFGEMG